MKHACFLGKITPIAATIRFEAEAAWTADRTTSVPGVTAVLPRMHASRIRDISNGEQNRIDVRSR